MPKNKKQGIIFGIIMSYSMAIGMEIYNNAIQQGIHLKPGGFTNLTYGVVGHALLEALFMGLVVILVVGQPAGRETGGKGMRPGEGQSVFLPPYAAGLHDPGHVPQHESGGHHYLQRDPGRRAAGGAAGKMVRYAAEKRPHGVLLEYVCRRAIYQLAVRQAVQIMSLFLCRLAARK